MTTLAATIYNVAKRCAEVVEGVSTDTGSTTTLIDSALDNYPTDWFAGGTMIILSGTYINTTRQITDYSASNKRFTFSAYAGAVPASVAYAAVRPTFNRGALLQAINAALGEMGMVTQVDETLDVLDGVEEYTLPSGVYNVVRVEVGENASAPYSWRKNSFWEEQGGKLLFEPGKEPSNVGNPMRLYYNAPHAAVSLDADLVSNAIHQERLAWAAAWQALNARLRMLGRDDAAIKDRIGLAAQKNQEMAAKHPVRVMGRSARLSW